MKKNSYILEFETFWKRYPHRETPRYKIEAWEAWERRRLTPLHDVVAFALERDAAEKHALLKRDRFAPAWPDAVRWLRRLDVDRAKREMLEQKQARIFAESATDDDKEELTEIERRHMAKLNREKDERARDLGAEVDAMVEEKKEREREEMNEVYRERIRKAVLGLKRSRPR